MATIGKVRAVFTASTSGLTSGVNAAGSSMRRLRSDVAGVRSSMSALVAINGAQLFGSIISGATQLGRTLIGMGAAQAEVIDSTNKLAARLGLTYGEMAGLANAGALVDVGMETIAKGIQKAEIAFSKAAGGSKTASAAFESIGLSVESLNGMTAEQRFEAIAQAISQLPTEAERAAAAVRIFGRAGVELLPMFEQGAAGIQAARAEAERFGLTLTQAQADNVDAMGDSFDRARQAIAGVTQQVVAYLAPGIEAIVTQFSDFIGEVGGATIGQRIGQGILEGARFFAEIADAVIASLSGVWEYVSQVGAQWAAVFEVGQRVASFFSGIGNLLQAAFDAIIIGLAGIGEGIVLALKAAGDALGFDTSGLDGTLSMFQDFREGMTDDLMQNVVDAGNNFSDAWFGEAETAGEAIAGPITSLVDDAIARAEAAAAATGDVAPVQRVGTAPPSAAEEAQPVREAIRGLDVRSAEGIKEMQRLMRQGGQTVQEEQLAEQKRTNQILEQRLGEDDFDVAEFAPAAGT
jgi:hypothetical protein